MHDFLIFHKSYGKKNIYTIESHEYIDVFYDTGNGFSEAEKDTFSQFPITVFSKEGLRSIRIDPSAQHCIVKDIVVKTENEAVSFTTNA